MKTWELQSFGLGGLTLVDRDPPRPGPGQVLVRQKALSLNYRDLMLVKGDYNPRLRFPFTPLSDGAGEVVEVGPRVNHVKAGARVAGTFMQRWPAGPPTEEAGKSALGGAIPGVAAEFVVLEEGGVVSLPEHLSYEEAATLPCAAVTAWNALVCSGAVKEGETVLIQGTGGVSIFALQFARMHGARVIAISSSDEKLTRVLQLGAEGGINYRSNDHWEEKVRELTGGVDHVVEVGGAGTLGKSLRAVKTAGHIALIGVLTGGAGTVNPLPLLMKSVRLQGIFVGSRSMFEAMNRAIAMHQMRPVIDRQFSFTELSQALTYLQSGNHFGKIVLTA